MIERRRSSAGSDGVHSVRPPGASQWRIHAGGDPRVPRIPPFPFSLYSYVALVQLLASYLSVFVAIVVRFNDCTCCFDVSTAKSSGVGAGGQPRQMPDQYL